MFDGFSINIFAVLVSIVVVMVIGALWYSPLLFGNLWLDLIGKKADDISKEDANMSMSLSVIPAVVTVFGLAILVEISSAATVFDALVAGTLASVFFSGMSSFNLVFFEDRSIKLTLLNAGYPFVAWNICAVILTLWQ